MSGPAIVINLTIVGTGTVVIRSSIGMITHTGPGTFSDTIGVPPGGAEFTATGNSSDAFLRWEVDLSGSVNPLYVSWSTLGYPDVTTYNITAVFGSALPPPPIDRRRVYWPTQQERADAMHLCRCPSACANGCVRRFTSSEARLRAERARYAGCCCCTSSVGCGNATTAKLYAATPRVQGGLPCSTVPPVIE
jgi:hypothetical protein